MKILDDFWSAVAIARTVRSWAPFWPADRAALPPNCSLLRAIDQSRHTADPHERLAAVELILALDLPGLDDWLAEAAGDADTEVRTLARGEADPLAMPPAPQPLADDDPWRLWLTDPDCDAAEWGQVTLQTMTRDPGAGVARLADGLCHRQAVIRELSAMLLSTVPAAATAWTTARRCLEVKRRLDDAASLTGLPVTPGLIRQAAAHLITPDGQLSIPLLRFMLGAPAVLAKASLDPLDLGELRQIIEALRSGNVDPAAVAALEMHRTIREMVEQLPAPRLVHFASTPMHVGSPVQDCAARAAREAARALLRSLAQRHDRDQSLRELGITSAPAMVVAEPPPTDPPASDAEAITRLSDDRPWVRCESAWALATVREPAAVRALLRRLGDPDAAVRRAAADALGATVRVDALADLTRRAADSRAFVRHAVAHILGAWSQPESTAVLLVLADDPEPDVRCSAISGLARLTRQGHADSATREHLVAAVRRFRDTACLPALNA